MWKPGDVIALRGIYRERIWYVQSTFVIRDTPQEVILAIIPGAECAASEGYIDGKHGSNNGWDRWEDFKRNTPTLRKFSWHTNRLLLILEPQKYYATICFWVDESNEFSCYYTNFQVPLRRSYRGFDTLDLELDIIVNPDFTWQWKDFDEYQRGVESGIISSEQVREIESAKREVFDRIEKRQYPYDASWLNWIPDPTWSPPKLPKDWDKM